MVNACPELDGMEYYRVLGIEKSASADDIRKAYRDKALKHHPDKGGDTATFAQLSTAFRVLIDPQQRRTYDLLAGETAFRPGGTRPNFEGLEQVLVDDLLHNNSSSTTGSTSTDPGAQVVLVCEMCGLPASKRCWICTMDICALCTRRQHWKGEWQLHWPLVNSPALRERLARRELEQKRKEDADKYLLTDPNHRPLEQLKEIRRAKDAVAKAQLLPSYQVRYHLELARYYKWAQTDSHLLLAVHIPWASADTPLQLSVSQQGIQVGTEGSAALVDRLWAGPIAGLPAAEELPAAGYGQGGGGVETWCSSDHQMVVIKLAKGQPGQTWSKLFRGDSDGARCLLPPYMLHEGEEDVVMELQLPFWTEPEDVHVTIGPEQLRVRVRGGADVCRSYWRNRGEEQKRDDYSVLDVKACCWSLSTAAAAAGGGRRRSKVLSITLVRPPPTADEVEYKKGVRGDNRSAERPAGLWGAGQRGFRFLADDEDEFGLEEVLQALVFLETGRVLLAPKPWQHGSAPALVARADQLPQQVRRYVEQMGGAAGGAGQQLVKA